MLCVKNIFGELIEKIEEISRVWRRKRHFVEISPRREHQAREALCGHFPQCEITARSHGTGERACTHGGAFDRAESGVLRASLRKLITLNLRYRSIGRTDRPTDRGRVVKRKSDIFGDAPRYCRAHTSSRMECAFVPAFMTP